jgi:signal transduction histidine kinase
MQQSFDLTNEQILKALLENIPSGLVIADANGIVRMASVYLSNLLKLPLTELEGHVMHPENWGLSKKGLSRTPVYSDLPLYRVIKNKEIIRDEEWMIRNSDGEKILSLDAGPILSSEGNIIGGLNCWHDITIRKKLEIGLEKQSQQLELTNRELQAFCYSVSHDLRAPLLSIMGFSNIIKEEHGTLLDRDTLDLFNRIIHSAQKMNHLIEDMLMLSGVSQRAFNRQVIDMSEIAISILSELKEKQPDRKAQFIIHEHIIATADYGLMQIALQNLLNNSWKFTRNKDPSIIEFGSVQKGDKTVFFVKDNGTGFDMKHADKLFMPFQRLHSEKEFPGTGIGLAIVERVIIRHGGKIWAESELGKGTTFFFTLP